MADADVLKCIRMLTFLPLEEIDAMDKWEGSELNKAKEILAMRLAVTHNLYFYNNLMKRIREELDNGTFTEFKNKYVDLLDTRI